MKECRYFELQIASIGIRVESCVPVEISERCRCFMSEKRISDADVRIAVKYGEFGFGGHETVLSLGNIQIRKKEKEILKIKYTDYSMRMVEWVAKWEQPEKRKGGACFYEIFVPGQSGGMKNMNPLMFVELSDFFLRFDAVILHSAVVDCKGNGILFTAPSGTGKSTQASLWELYKEAEVINGDRAIIRKYENGYQVYGSPYAGSSRIYKNKRAKVKAVAVLRQGRTNRIRRLGGKEAYISLFSELSVSEWDRSVIEGQAQWLEKFIDTVPVYLLECRPDREAVEVLYNELKAGINDNG